MKKYLFIMLLTSIAQNFLVILWSIILIIMSPIYLVGIWFWDLETSRIVVNRYQQRTLKIKEDE